MNILTKTLKAEGCFPDTWRVLHNIDKDKELANEKLAIAYVLMCTAPGNQFKHTRTLGYVQIAIQQPSISKVIRREIVAKVQT